MFPSTMQVTPSTTNQNSLSLSFGSQLSSTQFLILRPLNLVNLVLHNLKKNSKKRQHNGCPTGLGVHEVWGQYMCHEDYWSLVSVLLGTGDKKRLVIRTPGIVYKSFKNWAEPLQGLGTGQINVITNRKTLVYSFVLPPKDTKNWIWYIFFITTSS